MKILFVDDDPAIRDLWKDQCEEAGLENISVLPYGFSALEAIQRMGDDIAVLVCDGELPMSWKGTPEYCIGKTVLQAAKDAGIPHRIVVSGDDGYCIRCVAEGLATETAKKEDVVALVAEIVKAGE